MAEARRAITCQGLRELHPRHVAGTPASRSTLARAPSGSKPLTVGGHLRRALPPARATGPRPRPPASWAAMGDPTGRGRRARARRGEVATLWDNDSTTRLQSLTDIRWASAPVPGPTERPILVLFCASKEARADRRLRFRAARGTHRPGPGRAPRPLPTPRREA